MRTIKFRAWDSKRNLLLRIGLIDISSNTIYNAKSEDGYEFSYVDKESKRYFEDKENWGVYQDLIIMQYTGVTDKNGKEIFEGDILKCFNGGQDKVGTLVHVCYDDTYTGYYPFNRDEVGFNTNSNSIEVIGNIHEHKNLLKENEK